jgi:predicted O-methyltransferase YrrM
MAEIETTAQNYNHYVSALFAPEDDALRATLRESSQEGLPQINVSASEGKLLHLLALMIGARRILEIGTLGGYSTTWLARALPEGGKLITLELDPHHADVSKRNLERAGLGAKTEVIVGPAADSLDNLRAANSEPFDLIFIDADKKGYPVYLEKAFPLVREGGLILGDNALSRENAVLDPSSDNGITRYNKAVAAHPDLVSVIIPVLREGIDGLLVSLKRSRSL